MVFICCKFSLLDVISNELRKKLNRNIQIIDGAKNCVYDIFQTNEADFKLIFPKEGQNIQFIEDLDTDTEEMIRVFTNLWNHPVKKEKVIGIHGTLFYQMEYKKEYYPRKIDGCEEQKNLNLRRE